MEWRTHPALSGKLHPDYPDDIQVIIHDGGPRITTLRPELAWATITGIGRGHFIGRLITAPERLTSIQLNQTINFITTSSNHPIMVSEKYLKERAAWHITGCDKCGFDELFDAPSDLIRVIFPNVPADAEMEGFSAFCPLCGGGQIIEARPGPAADEAGASARPWWKFWS